MKMSLMAAAISSGWTFESPGEGQSLRSNGVIEIFGRAPGSLPSAMVSFVRSIDMTCLKIPKSKVYEDFGNYEFGCHRRAGKEHKCALGRFEKKYKSRDEGRSNGKHLRVVYPREAIRCVSYWEPYT